jgi:hypothetical protein
MDRQQADVEDFLPIATPVLRDLSEDALVEAADELFRALDAEEGGTP